MSDFLRATGILFEHQVTTGLRSKRFFFCLLLALLPVGFAFLLWQLVPAGESPPVATFAWMLVAQLVLPITSLVFGSAVISEEASDRTVTFLFTRPIPRASVLVGRWLACLVLVGLLLLISSFGVASLLTLAFPEGVATGTVIELAAPMAGVMILGLAVYTAGFAALGTFFKHPMIIGIAYVFAIELFLGTIPVVGNLQKLAVQFHLRALLADWGTAPWRTDGLFQSDAGTRATRDGLSPFAFGAVESGGEALTVLLVSLVVLLGLGMRVLSRKQYELTA